MLTLINLQECIGFELPEWTKLVWPENITNAAVQEYQVSTATTQMRRLSGGNNFCKKGMFIIKNSVLQNIIISSGVFAFIIQNVNLL